VNSAFSSSRVEIAVPVPAGSGVPAAGVPCPVIALGEGSAMVISDRNCEVTVLKNRSIFPRPWGR